MFPLILNEAQHTAAHVSHVGVRQCLVGSYEYHLTPLAPRLFFIAPWHFCRRDDDHVLAARGRLPVRRR
jgi:hypothetical protein